MPGEIPDDVYRRAKEQILNDLHSEDIRTRVNRLLILRKGLEAVKDKLLAEAEEGPRVVIHDLDDRVNRSDRFKLSHMINRSLAFELEKLSQQHPEGFQFDTGPIAAIDYLIGRVNNLTIGAENKKQYNYFKETPLDLVVAILHLTGNDDYLA